LVPRFHLPKWYAKAASAKLILVSAPAGFGKTTLLLQWLELAQGEGRKAAWLTLDSGDNDPVRFLTYLEGALRTLDPALKIGLEPAVNPVGGPVPATLLSSLLDWINTIEIPFVLFLDDFDAVANPEIHDVLRRIIENLPLGRQLVLATRETPQLPLSRMRAADQVFEIGTAQLRFSLEEAGRLLQTNGTAPWDRDDLTHLNHCAEGWAAGLKLALLALGGRQDIRSLVGSFSGSFAEIEDYLWQEVLSRQPESVRDFLLKTSILERLTGPLCEAVTGCDGAYDMLVHLERANLFVTPLDPERRWYRYDTLFAQFLRSRLERDLEGGVAALHSAAADWLEGQAAYEPAAEHALAADDAERAADLMAHCARTLVNLGQIDTVLRWTKRLPVDAVEHQPELWVAHCWALVFRRRDCEAARATIARLCSTVAGLEGSAVRDEALALQGMVLNIEELGEEAHRTFSESLARISDRRSFAFGVLSDALGASLVAAGRFDEAEECLLETLANQGSSEVTLVGVYSECVRVIIRMIRGRHRDALSLARSVYLRTAEAFPPHSLPRAVSANALAEALYESDELAEAEALLAASLTFMSDYGPSGSAEAAYRTLSRIHRARGREEEAERLLEEADRLGRAAGVPLLCVGARLERTSIALRRGDTAEAERLLATLQGHPLLRPGAIFLGPQPDLLTWSLRIAKGEGEPVLAELRSALSKAESEGRLRLALCLRILEARALDACDRRRPALRVLCRALQAGYREGFVRTFVDAEPAVVGLVRILRHEHWEDGGQSPADLPVSYLDRILSSAGCAGATLAPEAPSPGSPDFASALTPRELDVLRLSGLGLSYQAVADRLFVTLKTVKFHMGNIFVKLGVGSRTEAVLKARRVGLIP
jgi:LuxR family transcriptional regulator, maltose regulon positive regulatory protein